jgi:regulation of enolase protein 1 (concanavalin A-like superfamily)
LIGVFVFARPKPQDTIAVATAIPAKSTPAPVESFGLKSELQALASRDEKAASLMEAAAARDSATANERAWAQLFEGAAYLSDGHIDKARTAFQKVDALAAEVKEPQLSGFLRTVSARLAKPDQIPLAEAQKFRKENYEAVGHLLYGLHNWRSGAPEDGAAMLRQFRNSTDSAEWLKELKPLASHFVEQLVSYQMAVDAMKGATSTSERASAAKALRKLEPALARHAEAVIAPFETEIGKFEGSNTKIPDPALYRIYNKHSKLVLDVDQRGRNEGAKIIQFSSGGTTNQTWELIRVSGDTFRLRAVHSGLVLNLPNSTTKPGTGLWQWKDDSTAASLWKLEPQGDGWFFIRSALSNQVLGVDKMSTSNGASVTQWDKPGSEDHYWRFERVGARISDWFALDIGAAKGPAYTKIKGNSISIEVNNLDIWTKKDSCRFVFRDVVGDFDFVAQLTEMTDVTDWTKTGIMVRSTLWPSSRNLLFGLSGRRGVIRQRRAEDNADTTQERSRDDLKGPAWIKLTRRGSTFTGFHSRDGKTWTEVCSEQLEFQNSAIVGLATSSWGTGKTFNVRYENVSLTQP